MEGRFFFFSRILNKDILYLEDGYVIKGTYIDIFQ